METITYQLNLVLLLHIDKMKITKIEIENLLKAYDKFMNYDNDFKK